MDTRDPLMLVLPRPEIEALDLGPFLRRFGASALPKGAELGALMGRFNFMIHGYDDDPHEVYAIEEVRAFYRKLREEWPYWLFFCDLRTDGLMMMTLCCLNELSGAKKLGEPAAQVMFDPLDIVIGLINSPAIGGVEPDFCHVPPRGGAKRKADHAAPL